jgi:hypothetical protein
VRPLIGRWEGTASGQAGEGSVARSYEFVPGKRYLHERNTSVYPPQQKYKTGEVHQHWSFISCDRARQTLVMRQFHVEGLVDQYVFNPGASTATRLVFDSERFENFSNTWRASETYELLGPDEFVKTFELAPPDKPLQTYSRNHFKRSAP